MDDAESGHGALGLAGEGTNAGSERRAAPRPFPRASGEALRDVHALEASEVESSVGAGTTLYVRLPLNSMSDDAKVPAETADSDGSVAP
jgi:hypothetical protein